MSSSNIKHVKESYSNYIEYWFLIEDEPNLKGGSIVAAIIKTGEFKYYESHKERVLALIKKENRKEKLKKIF